MTILINDLKRHNAAISGEIEQAIGRVLASGWYILGSEVSAFEAEFAVYCGVAHCVTTANGTDALELALRAVGVQPGDKVATVANAGMYSTISILNVGAEPLFCDVEARRMTMSPEALGERLTARTKAIIVTHLYGQMADMPRLLEVSTARGIPLIEDCAQAHGAQLQGRPAGSWGVMGCFSFYPTKNLGALGDGGALTTSDAGLAARAKLLRQYGWTRRYESEVPGGRNSRLDEMQAAILRAKLPHLAGWNERRRAIAARYSAGLQGLGFTLPCGEEEDYVAHLYVIRLPQRERMKAHLASRGIGSDVHYPIPDYRQRSIQGRGLDLTPLPVTEQCSRDILTLPCFPELTDSEVEQIIAAVSEDCASMA